MAKSLAAITIVSLLCSLTAAEAEEPSWKYPTAKMPAWHAQAIAVALREFKSKQGGKTDRSEPVYGDLRHYSVDVSHSPPDQLPIGYARDESVRVSFVPDLSTRDRQRVIAGGRTSFGIEVSYDVSRRTMKIVKTSFAR